MKVVLFCGGKGMRLREYSEQIPKPMVPIGYRPILWYLMKYYAHFGHKEFILCLGYRADVVKNYFVNYAEYLSNDFVLSEGGKQIDLLASDIADWKITFVETGSDTNIAGRLVAVREHLGTDEFFLANYADGLCDLPLDRFVDPFKEGDAIAKFVSVPPTTSFHIVDAKEDGIVSNVRELSTSGVWMNGGFFVFRKEIFDYIHPGEEIVNEPFARLIKEGRLVTERYNGFWMSMDTFKDKQFLDDLYSRGNAPWEVWKEAEESWPDPRKDHAYRRFDDVKPST